MAAAKILGISAGFKFQPDDDELIEFFLVPRLRGQALPLDGIIVDEDPLSAPPWELFNRNGLDQKENAYFFAPGDAANGRKVRACAGVGTWVNQKPEKGGEVRVGEEIFTWQKYRFNFQPGAGRSGSTGYVMMEYSIVAPDDRPNFKVCRISHSGHGKKRKRVPDGYSDNDSAVTNQQQQVAAPSSSTATSYEDPNPNATHACYQDQDQDHLLMQPQDAGVDEVTTGPSIIQDQEHFLMQPQGYNYAGVDGLTGPWIYQHQQPLAMMTQQQFADQELFNLGNFNLPTMDHRGMMPVHMEQETCAPEQLVDYRTMPLPIHQEQSDDYGYGMMPPPMGQGSGMPPQQFFDNDPMPQQLLESTGDFTTAAQADPCFGDPWGSDGQDYHHHHLS